MESSESRCTDRFETSSLAMPKYGIQSQTICGRGDETAGAPRDGTDICER